MFGAMKTNEHSSRSKNPMVRTLKLFTQALTAIALLAGSTHARGVEDELPPYDGETVVTDLAVVAHADAYTISGVVEAGGNPCRASSVSVEFRLQEDGPRTFVVPYLRDMDPYRICTMEYRPVHKTITIDVARPLIEGGAVFVKNVGAAGTLVNVEAR